MLDLNERFRSYLAASNYRPRITIAVHFDDTATDIVYFTSHDENQRPTGAGVQAVDGCLRNPTGATQKIDPKNHTSSIGGISFDLVDVNNEVTAIFAQKESEGKSPREKLVQVFTGFGPQLFSQPAPFTPQQYESLDWLDYEPAFTMLFKSYEAGPGFLSIQAEDVQRLENNDLFITDVSTLTVSIGANDPLIPVAEILSSDKFTLVEHDADYSDQPGATVGYVRIENEIICHQGFVDDAVLGTCLDVVERGALNTQNVGHGVDQTEADDKKTKVEEVVYLEGPALKILYAIQTGVLYGQGSETLPSGWHQGIDTSLVRLTDYEDANPALWDPATGRGVKVRFIGEKKQNGEQFISQQILPLVGGIRPVYSDGAIGFKLLLTIIHNASYEAELNDDNIVGMGRLKHDLPNVVNEITIDWDYDFITKEYLQPTVLIDLGSVAKYKRGLTRRYQFRGLKSSLETQETIINAFDSIRNRYAGGGFILSVDLMPNQYGIEVGSVVRINTSKIIDPLTGSALDRVFEVLQTSVNLKTGAPKITAFASVESAGQFEVLTANTVMNDGFYSSEGTDLDSLPEVSGGVINSDVTLIGGATMGDAVYYHLGDLELASGVELTITQNVQLRIRGFFTRNGDIIGRGNGHAGGAGGTVFEESGTTTLSAQTGTSNYFATFLINASRNTYYTRTNEGLGTLGHLGFVRPPNSVKMYEITSIQTGAFVGHVIGHPFKGGGRYPEAQHLNISNRDGDTLEGVNTLDLRGTSGPGGQPLIYNREDTSPERHDIVQSGAAGGASGAGLVVICRGESVGAGSTVDLSGEDGSTPALFNFQIWGPGAGTVDVANGGGAGGAPGAYYLLIDGSATYDTSSSNVTLERGDPGILAGTNDVILKDQPNISGSLEFDVVNAMAGTDIGVGHFHDTPKDISEAAHFVQRIRPPENVRTTPITPPKYQLQNFIAPVTLTSGDATMIRLKDGSIQERIRVDFLPSLEPQAVDYEVQAKFWGEADSEYRTVAVPTNNWAYFDVEEGEAYAVRVRVRGINTEVDPSDWVSSGQHVAEGKGAIPSTPTGMSFSHANDGRCIINFDEHPDADFLRFVITRFDPWPSGTVQAEGPLTQFDLGYLATNAYIMYGVAQDTSGNNSADVSVAFTIPSVSFPSATVMYENGNVRLDITPGGSHPYPVEYYSLFYDGVEIARISDETHIRAVNWSGSRDFGLRQTLRGGFSGSTNTITVNPAPPSTPTMTAQVYGQSVTLRYSATPGDLPIERFVLYVGPTFGTATRFDDKAGTSTFTIKDEFQAGTYNYWLVARDTAGNESSPGSASAIVNGGDFTIFDNFEGHPSFSGTITNGRIHESSLLLLINNTMTFNTYGAQHQYFQDRINAGLTYYLPPTTTASYVETFDAGAIIPTAQINTTVVSEAYQGSPGVTWSVAFSADNSTWSSEDSTGSFIATDARYIRLTINATGDGNDIARIISASLQLSIQEQTESGTVVCSSGDSGGTAITFAKDWLDISAITATVYGTSSHKVVINFTDVANPSPPQFLIFNDSGVRQNGTVSYTIRGVVDA